MNNDIQELIENAIEELSDYYANRGCNDIEFPDTPEMRALYHEYSLDNCPEATGPWHSQYMNPYEKGGSTLGGDDGFIIFLMRRMIKGDL